MTHFQVVNRSIALADAKARLSSLVIQAGDGAEFIVTRHGRPVAKIVGVPKDVVREPGGWAWRGNYEKSLFAPMTDDEAREEGWPV